MLCVSAFTVSVERCSGGGVSLHGARAAGQQVLHVHRHGLGEVGHAPEAATGGAVVQQPAHSGGRVAVQDMLRRSQVHLEREDGSSERTGSQSVGADAGEFDAHLVFEEHVVRQVDDLLDVDDGADARDVHVGQHGEHQDGLHQQLPVLGLRDAVQDRLHVDGELDFSRRHLEKEGRQRTTRGRRDGELEKLPM